MTWRKHYTFVKNPQNRQPQEQTRTRTTDFEREGCASVGPTLTMSRCGSRLVRAAKRPWAQGVWEPSLPPARFCCEPETALKKKLSD